MKSDIAIIGVSVNVTDIENLEEFGDFLEKNKTGFNGLSEVRKKDIFDRFGEFEAAPRSYLDRVDLFDNVFFKIAPAEAERMDPEQRLMMEATVKAVHNAGYLIKELKGQRIGVFHTIAESQYRYFFDDASNLSLTSHMPGMVGTRVANFMDWRGPVLGIDTTCSSSLTALYYACQSINNGDCNMALIGGANLKVFSKEMIKHSPVNSKKGYCLPFDDDADGILGGEGVFCVLIKKAADAIRDKDPIHAIIKGGAINHGGELIQNISAPSPISQSEVIKMAWTNSGVDPKDIHFIEAHGTGTLLGDPIEFKGLTSAFEEIAERGHKKCAISSVKGQLGHLDSLAGLAGLTKLLLALKNKKLFPQTGFKRINKHIDEENSSVKIQREVEHWENNGKLRLGGVSSYGLTGTNVHMVLEEYSIPVITNSTQKDNYTYSLKVSGSTQTKAIRINEYLQRYLQTFPDVNLGQLCYSVNKMLTDENQYGQIIVFKNLEELVLGLKNISFDKPKQVVKDQLILLIPEILDRSNLLSFLGQSSNFSVTYDTLKDLCKTYKTGEIAERFLLHYCAIKTLMESGFVPDSIIGGQAGKFLSLSLSGKIPLEEAIEKLNTTTAEVGSFNSKGFVQFLNSLDETKNYTITIMGNSGEMVETFKHWMSDTKPKKNIKVIFPKHESDACLEIIASYYNEGNNLNFDKLLGKELFLHNLYLPVFEQKRFWPTVKPAFTASALPNKENAIDTDFKHQLLELEEIIAIVHDIWSEKLKIDSIDRITDFFDIGGSSLLGLDVLQQIEKRFEANLEYADIFDYSTILSQAELIKEKLDSVNQKLSTPNPEKKNTATLLADTTQRTKVYNELLFQINKIQEVRKVFPKDIFVTGGTGFLGVHVIKDILLNTGSRIFCLVRAQNDEMALERLLQNFRSYFPDFEFDSNRLIGIKGNITQSHLDLSRNAKLLLQSVDSVFHLAANVSHYGKTELADKINTDGTANMLEWSKSNNVKNFNHFSTIAIARGYINEIDNTNFYESDLDIGQNFARRIYSNSKFKAEQYIHKHKADLNVNIFRIGNISGDSNTGLFQHNIESNNVYQRIKTLSALSYYSEELLNHEFETTPVNIVSEIVVKLSLYKNEVLNTFHILESAPIRSAEIISQLELHQIKLKKVNSKEFLEHVNQLGTDSKLSEENVIIGISKYSGNNIPYTRFVVNQKATKEYLDKIGINYKYDISKYANTLVKYCIEKEFIKQVVKD